MINVVPHAHQCWIQDNIAVQINKQIFSVRNAANGQTKAIVYIAYCTICNIQYVGETPMTMPRRINLRRARFQTLFNGRKVFECSNSLSIGRSLTQRPTVAPVTIVPTEYAMNYNIYDLNFRLTLHNDQPLIFQVKRNERRHTSVAAFDATAPIIPVSTNVFANDIHFLQNMPALTAIPIPPAEPAEPLPYFLAEHRTSTDFPPNLIITKSVILHLTYCFFNLTTQMNALYPMLPSLD
ncbi:hypothetical protein GJ496_004008 [Pomphorhynchus laevis]|nr:hypothetical protein GJ496_004008 [Pomphorhynchus laevis]